jgi:hypothetical protein
MPKPPFSKSNREQPFGVDQKSDNQRHRIENRHGHDWRGLMSATAPSLPDGRFLVHRWRSPPFSACSQFRGRVNIQGYDSWCLADAHSFK